MTQFIAIVGCGPKGLYGFERLAAQFRAFPPSQPVEIHLFNRTKNFGSGDIYDPSQPDYLWINYAIGNINMWIDEQPAPVVENPQALTAWLRQQKGLNVTETDFTSRAQVGEYLQDGFRAILNNLPAEVTVRCFVGNVVDCWLEKDAYRLQMASDGQTLTLPAYYKELLLATGHPRNAPKATWMQFSRSRAGVQYVPFIYPVEPNLNKVPAKESVIIKGMGLTFVDAVLALTEGRNGRFTQKNDHYIYHPSGLEPNAIYPYSRSGLPMLPRAGQVGAPQQALHFFTHDALQTLSKNGRKVDFEKELWPLLTQEMMVAYYQVLLRNQGAPPLDPSDTFAEIMARIDRFHQQYPHSERFNVKDFFDPLNGRTPLSPADLHQFIFTYWHDGVQSAEAGETKSPTAAVMAVWRLATAVFRRVYAFGGLTATSHQQFLETYAGSLNRVTFGPPVPNVKKLLALASAGILRFDFCRGARVVCDEENGRFLLQYNDHQVEASSLIDARIPKNSLTQNCSPLVDNLLKRGLAQPFVNADETGRYQPGCLALSAEGYLLDENGHKPTIAVTGTPTEGVVYDNDSLSRHCNNFVSYWAAEVRLRERTRNE